MAAIGFHAAKAFAASDLTRCIAKPMCETARIAIACARDGRAVCVLAPSGKPDCDSRHED